MHPLFRFLALWLLFILSAAQAQNVLRYVDPFIGTGGHGHTFPGATVPFGMVQASPDTRTEGWDWCSGYHASDTSIMGFSHTHLSGTGGADYGDILLMPVAGAPVFVPGSIDSPGTGYRSTFSRATERATPGYYTVYLSGPNVLAELTATLRTALHRYTYANPAQAALLIDLNHGIQDVTKASYFRLISPTEAEGWRQSGGWANNHTVYFRVQFSASVSGLQLAEGAAAVPNQRELRGTAVKARLSFLLPAGQPLLVKIGISHTSLAGAAANLAAEQQGFAFAAVKKAAEAAWQAELGRVQVTGGTQEQTTVFYTALYHACIAPNTFSDADGSYMGMDGKIKAGKGYPQYTVLSLWDTYRALNPLLTLLNPGLTRQLVLSLYDKYTEFGLLPVWELAANETNCMIGYHSIPVIADAILKGISFPNLPALYAAMRHSAMQDKLGLEFYKRMGFIPMDREEDAVSKTLEYAYDDWCIAQVANKLGYTDDYQLFMNRAQNYKNVFDPQTRFMRGRLNNGNWKPVFDPAEPFPWGAGEFTEGSSWQYTWYVPQDVSGLQKLMGGREAFAAKLDSLFRQDSVAGYQVPSDMTGLIGQYAHGNEPSHHIAYLYNFAGMPYKTQARVRSIMDGLYHTGRDGLCGNEDCGQMSAWLVFSAMGFYPVTPASNTYIIGSPWFSGITITPQGGKPFTIAAAGNNPRNVYIGGALLNGKPHRRGRLSHGQLSAGGTLRLTMQPTPAKNLWALPNECPVTAIPADGFIPAGQRVVFEPTISVPERVFARSKTFTISSTTPGAVVTYTTNGQQPLISSTAVTCAITLSNSAVVKARAFHPTLPPSPITEATFIKAVPIDSLNPFYAANGTIYPRLTLGTATHRHYTGGGQNALLDGIRSPRSFKSGKWQGYYGVNLLATIDLGRPALIHEVGIGLLQNQGSWIFNPERVTFEYSADGNTWQPIADEDMHLAPSDDITITDLRKQTNITARYIRVTAKNPGICPPWHKAAGYTAFIFADEIFIDAE